MAQHNFCGRTRREFLWQTGAGFGAVALADMLSRDGFFSSASAADSVSVNPLAAKPPHFAAKPRALSFYSCMVARAILIRLTTNRTWSAKMARQLPLRPSAAVAIATKGVS